MRKLRRLALGFTLAAAAMVFNPLTIQAVEPPEPPNPECVWSGSTEGLNGTWFGAYMCSNGCDYPYVYSDGDWSEEDPVCEAN